MSLLKFSRDYNSSTRASYGFKDLLHLLNAIVISYETGLV